MICKRNLIFLFFLLFVEVLISQSSSDNPNFIFILADDQGWNGTSVEMINGLKESKSDFYETPNIEKLANQGIKFSYAYSGAPVCAPSRYSIQFGQTPARLKMIRVGMNTEHIKHDSDFTIPKQLKKINPKNLSEEKSIQMKILSTSEDQYIFEYSFVGDVENRNRGQAKKISDQILIKFD